MQKIGQGIVQLLDELQGEDAGSSSDIWLEEQVKDAVISVFKAGAPYILNRINGVYLFDKGGVKQFALYSDDSAARASLDARQGLLKLALLKRGISYDELKIYPSKQTMKNRHPFVEQEQNNVKKSEQPFRELTSEEFCEIESIIQDIDDPELKEAVKQALISDFRTSFPDNV